MVRQIGTLKKYLTAKPWSNKDSQRDFTHFQENIKNRDKVLSKFFLISDLEYFRTKTQNMGGVGSSHHKPFISVTHD